MLAVAAIAASILFTRNRQVPGIVELQKPKVVGDVAPLEALRAAGF